MLTRTELRLRARAIRAELARRTVIGEPDSNDLPGDHLQYVSTNALKENLWALECELRKHGGCG